MEAQLATAQSTYVARVSSGKVGPRATIANWCVFTVVKDLCSATVSPKLLRHSARLRMLDTCTIFSGQIGQPLGKVWLNERPIVRVRGEMFSHLYETGIILRVSLY